MLVRIGIVLSSIFFVLIGGNQMTQAQVDYQYPLKAAYIYKFTKFISWKNWADHDTEFIIGILGDSEIYPYLNQIAAQKKVRSKVIVIEVHALRGLEAAKTINYCDILFVPFENAEYLDILTTIADDNTLLIGESNHFAERGGGINFVNFNNKLRFELNKSAIQRNGFKVSAQLLKLAILVEEE